MQRVTLIDNYDSFTFNLVHYLGELGADVSVWRNDEITIADALADKPDAMALTAHLSEGSAGEVVFENVRFGYQSNRMILKGIDFTVPAGGKLAIVGPTGAGKSTINRLLFRFYDVTGGRITVDGQDIRSVRQDSLRASIGIARTAVS